MSKSDYLEDEFLLWVTGQTSSFGPGVNGPYLALYTVVPNDAGGGTEVSGNGYVRVNTDGMWAAPINGTTQNQVVISFPKATGGSGFGTVRAVGLFDAATAGHLLHWTTVPPTQIGDQQTLKFNIGALVIIEDSEDTSAGGQAMFFGAGPPPPNLTHDDGSPLQDGDKYVDEETGDVFEFSEV
jgi:hypothetical protein